MARMKRLRRRKSAKKIAKRRVTVPGSASKRSLSGAHSQHVTAKRKRARTPTVKAAARRVLVSAGRAAKSLARAAAARAAHAGRKAVARGARSAAKGVQQAAQDAGDVTASALESIADRVEPQGN
jgi:hypothetical protein